MSHLALTFVHMKTVVKNVGTQGSLSLTTPLSIDEVEFRVSRFTKDKSGVFLLAYKDARADMNRLDAVVGNGFWQKRYEVIKGNLYCSVGIFNKELEQWVWKDDVGTESNTESQKGEASDAFKRACFNWGIGRELYSYPDIYIKLNPDESRMGNNVQFAIKKWRWASQFDENGNLTYLGCNDGKTMRYEFGKFRK